MKTAILALTFHVVFGLMYCIWAWCSWWKPNDLELTVWLKGSVVLLLVLGPLRAAYWCICIALSNRPALETLRLRWSWYRYGFFEDPLAITSASDKSSFKLSK